VISYCFGFVLHVSKAFCFVSCCFGLGPVGVCSGGVVSAWSRSNSAAARVESAVLCVDLLELVVFCQLRTVSAPT
jgi:hypothetical protein